MLTLITYLLVYFLAFKTAKRIPGRMTWQWTLILAGVYWVGLMSLIFLGTDAAYVSQPDLMILVWTWFIPHILLIVGILGMVEHYLRRKYCRKTPLGEL